MTVRRVMGTETEYAVSAPAVSHANPVQLSFDVIGAAADPERSRIRWDYRQEDPVNDARGTRLERAAARPDMLTDEPQLNIVNVIAPIMAEEHGPAWRQTTFYPFAEAALHARGQAYAPAISSPTIHTEAYGDVPAIDAVVTWDEQARTGLLLAVNRDANTPHTLTIDLSGLPGLPGLGTLALGKAQLLHEDDPYRTNTAEAPEAVTPQPLDIAMNATGTCTATLPAISWISVEFHG